MDNLFFAVALEAAYTLEEKDLGREDFLRELCERNGGTYWKDAQHE